MLSLFSCPLRLLGHPWKLNSPLRPQLRYTSAIFTFFFRLLTTTCSFNCPNCNGIKNICNSMFMHQYIPSALIIYKYILLDVCPERIDILLSGTHIYFWLSFLPAIVRLHHCIRLLNVYSD